MSSEIIIWIKKLIATLIFAIFCYGIFLSQGIIATLGVAGFFAMLIIPLVDKWKKHKIPEWMTVAIVYIILILMASIVVITIIPIVTNYVTGVISQVTRWSITAQETYQNYGISGFNLPKWIENMIVNMFNEENIGNTLDVLKQNAGAIQQFLTTHAAKVANSGLSILGSIGGVVTNWMFIGIAAFFIILERRAIAQVFLDVTPDRMENYFRNIYKEIQVVCISWVRATAILGFSIFLLTYIGLWIIIAIFGFEIENVFTLALISGIMEFVPYIGPILALIPALIIGLGVSWEATAAILILYIIVQQLENNVLVPYIMSRNLDISPLFVFIVMLFGATLGGILGIVLSVPIAGIIKVVYSDYIERKKSGTLPKSVAEITKDAEKTFENQNNKLSFQTVENVIDRKIAERIVNLQGKNIEMKTEENLKDGESVSKKMGKFFAKIASSAFVKTKNIISSISKK